MSFAGWRIAAAGCKLSGNQAITLEGAVIGVSAILYLMTTLGVGLLISTISTTQQQAMMTSTFFFLVPILLN